jgi:hypothetical protein
MFTSRNGASRKTATALLALGLCSGVGVTAAAAAPIPGVDAAAPAAQIQTAAKKTVMFTKYGDVKVRSNAGTKYKAVKTLSKRTRVTVTGTKKGSDGKSWSKISSPAAGWVRSDLLTLLKFGGPQDDETPMALFYNASCYEDMYMEGLELYRGIGGKLMSHVDAYYYKPDNSTYKNNMTVNGKDGVKIAYQWYTGGKYVRGQYKNGTKIPGAIGPDYKNGTGIAPKDKTGIGLKVTVTKPGYKKAAFWAEPLCEP